MTHFADLFPILFVIVGAIVAVVFAVVIVQAVANARKVREAGHNPLTLQADLTTKLLDSEVLNPRRSTAERLGELDRLRDDQVISADEYDVARARVLSSH